MSVSRPATRSSPPPLPAVACPRNTASHGSCPVVGTGRANDLLLSGRVLTGEQAGQIGLVEFVTSRETVLDEAVRYADEIATSCSPSAVAEIKRQLDEGAAGDFPAAFDRAQAALTKASTWPDFAEELRASSSGGSHGSRRWNDRGSLLVGRVPVRALADERERGPRIGAVDLACETVAVEYDLRERAGSGRISDEPGSFDLVSRILSASAIRAWYKWSFGARCVDSTTDSTSIVSFRVGSQTFDTCTVPGSIALTVVAGNMDTRMRVRSRRMKAWSSVYFM